MSRWWGLLAILAGWAGIVLWRRNMDRRAGAPSPRPRGDDDIDSEALERAEREVRDLETDVKGRPLEDVVGDDWGPGTPKPPFT